jgi:hypothetical protein
MTRKFSCDKFCKVFLWQVHLLKGNILDFEIKCTCHRKYGQSIQNLLFCMDQGRENLINNFLHLHGDVGQHLHGYGYYRLPYLVRRSYLDHCLMNGGLILT